VTDDIYAGREQSQTKHEMLRRYLESFAQIIGSHWQSITYVDGFSGPWNSVASDFSDSSFGIALQELRKARTKLSERGHRPRIRCFFVERDKTAYTTLASFASSQNDSETEIETRNKSFEEAIPEIVKFVRSDPQTFVFTFIDPKGWLGFAMDQIRPLIQLRPGEVLVNFMTSHIVRWIEHHATKDQIRATFGSDVSSEVAGLAGLKRTERCVDLYCEALGRTGNYPIVSPAIVLMPMEQRPHYHLIYATRGDKGLDVFKKAEKKAMDVMEKARASAEERRARAITKQRGLFAAEEMPESAYYNDLRLRYTAEAKTRALEILRDKGRVLYRDLWAISLVKPLVWESDLREWIKEWQTTGKLAIDNLGSERVPKWNREHILIWMETK